MTDEWDAQAEGWDSDIHVRTFADQALVSLSDYMSIQDGTWASKRVLDFGCGTGVLTERLAPHVGEIVACDTSEKMIDVLQAKGLPNVLAIHGDLLDKDQRTQDDRLTGFDLICASSVCAFLPDYPSAASILAGLLNPGGRFIQWDWQSTGDDGFGLTEEAMTDALNGAGLREVETKRAFEIKAETFHFTALVGTGLR